MARLYHANIPPQYLNHGETSDRVLRDFAAVGVPRPVELRKAQRVLLLRVLQRWVEEGDWSVDPDPRIPAELVALRDALIADLHDANSGSNSESTLGKVICLFSSLARLARYVSSSAITGFTRSQTLSSPSRA